MSWRFLFLSVMTLGLAACDETTVPAAPDGTGATGGILIGTGAFPITGGTPGTGGTAATGGSGGMGAGGTAGTGGSGGGGTGGVGGTVGAGQCTNAADLDALAGLGDPAIVRSTSAERASSFDCAPLVADEDRFVECVASGVRDQYGLSEECATCYGQLEWCSTALCASECAGDGSDVAAACSCESSFVCQQAGYSGCLTGLLGCTGDIPQCVED